MDFRCRRLWKVGYPTDHHRRFHVCSSMRVCAYVCACIGGWVSVKSSLSWTVGTPFTRSFSPLDTRVNLLRGVSCFFWGGTLKARGTSNLVEWECLIVGRLWVDVSWLWAWLPAPALYRVWCSFYWPFFFWIIRSAFSKAPANGNLFMKGSRKRGGFKRYFRPILKYYSILILTSILRGSLYWEKLKRDDTIERPDQIQS